jgi:hypothetical protein
MGNQKKSKTLHSKTHHERQKGHAYNFLYQSRSCLSVNAKFYKGKVFHKLKKYLKKAIKKNNVDRQLVPVVSGCCMTKLRHTKRPLYENNTETGKGCRASSLSLFARSCPLWLFPFCETQKTPWWKKNIKPEIISVRLFSSVWAVYLEKIMNTHLKDGLKHLNFVYHMVWWWWEFWRIEIIILALLVKYPVAFIFEHPS